MFNPERIISRLDKNRNVFQSLLSDTDDEQIYFQPAPGKWCLLEIVCHLYDEEREDFRARLKHVLTTPDQPLPSIDPQGWAASGKYKNRDFKIAFENFLDERKKSLDWLQSLPHPDWNQFYSHPKFGPMSGKLFLSNWLAHDYLHMRQIIFTRHSFLGTMSGENLKYAGDW
ncbi:MAG TPA: DinB family protein [Bacteroidia bacterium]|nr:DinB family protein [Bacteroidia bacterium]